MFISNRETNQQNKTVHFRKNSDSNEIFLRV